MAQISKVKCDFICGTNGASFYCYECKQNLCVSCRTIHDQVPMTKNHAVTDLNQVDLTLSSQIRCEKHNNAFIIFCKTCNNLICQDCLLSEHKEHEYLKIDEVAKEVRNTVRKMLADGESKLEEVVKVLTEINSSFPEQIEKDGKEQISKIETAASSFKSIIDLGQNLLVDEVNAHMHIEKEDIRMSISTLQNLKKELETSCQSLRQLLNVTHNTSFVAAFPKYKSMISQQDDIPQVQPPEKIDDFNIRKFLDKSIANVCERFKCDIYDKKDKEIDTLRQSLHDKEKGIRLLEDKMKTQEKEIKSFKEQTKKLETENANYRHNLQDKQEAIKLLEAKIDEREAENIYYSEKMKKKDEHIKQLQDAIKHIERKNSSEEKKIAESKQNDEFDIIPVPAPIGRRNRRFASAISDDANAKDYSNTNQRPPNQSSQSISRTVGGTKPPMEQVYTTPDGLVVKVYVGNILSLDVDCIVNATNENLQHGDGVAAVISQAARYSFDQESSDYIARNGPLPVGTCCSTSAGNLKYNYVIHTVGPRWGDYKFDEKKVCAADLKASLVCCFVEADRLQQNSIALPSISAGIFGVPKEVYITEYRKAVMEYSRNASRTITSLKEIHFIDKDYGLISLIQNEFGGSFNLSSQQSSASGGSNTPPSGKKPDFSRSMSSSSTSRSSSSLNDSFKSGQSLGGGSKNFNQTQKFETAVFVLQQKMRSEVKVGDITEMKVDAIVCPQDDLMTNRGAIARKIADIAGYDYQMEVARIYDVKKTGAKRMNAPKKCPWKYVIQTKPPRWNLDAQKHNQQFEKELEETVINILNASKFSTIKTLAMPLMGKAEKGDTPVKTFADQFAKAILKQIHDKDFTVGKMHIVVHDTGTASSILDVLDALDDKGCKRVGKSTHRKPKFDTEKSFAASVGDAEKLDGQCCICLDTLQNPKKLPCGHVFCTECIDQQFKYKPICPQCGATNRVITGTQPKGRMDITTRRFTLAGYEGHDTIVISYEIFSGVQGEEHQTPGRYFEGIKRSAYLPATKKGKMISKLLKIAFDRRLIFTIGTSTTTGKTGMVTWNDIYHKTNPNPDTLFGYPDPTYLDRVLEELAVKGVTEKDIKD